MILAKIFIRVLTSRSASILYLVIFLTGLSTGIIFYSIALVVMDLDLPPRGGIILIPSGSIALFMSLQPRDSLIPRDCQAYSLELISLVKIQGVVSPLLGGHIDNMSSFLNIELIEGRWPEKLWEVALGLSLSKALGLGLGSKVYIKDLVSGNAATYIVVGLYSSKDPQLERYLIMGEDGVRTLKGVSESLYSYSRISSACRPSKAEEYGVSLPMIIQRLVSGRVGGGGGVSVYKGGAPIINEILSIMAALVMILSGFVVAVSMMYADTAESEIMRLCSQGLPRRLAVAIMLSAAPFMVLTAFLSALISCYISLRVGAPLIHSNMYTLFLWPWIPVHVLSILVPSTVSLTLRGFSRCGG